MLVRHAVAYARREGLEVIPTCPFVGWAIHEDGLETADPAGS